MENCSIDFRKWAKSNYLKLNDDKTEFVIIATKQQLVKTHISTIECVHSCDQKPYLHNETKGGICIKIEFNPQKNVSLLQHGRRFFVYSSNMAAVTSFEHTLYAMVTLR